MFVGRRSDDEVERVASGLNEEEEEEEEEGENRAAAEEEEPTVRRRGLAGRSLRSKVS
jgi:hypothetical protein